jgi:hypothetical protein
LKEKAGTEFDGPGVQLSVDKTELINIDRLEILEGVVSNLLV